MKRKFIYIFLALFTSVGFAEEITKADLGVDLKQPITPSFYAGVIHLSDLNTSATAGDAMYTINSPGRYYVSGDLSLAPDNARVAGIQITASNVFLNLNEAVIFQRAGNTQTGLMGIEVAASVSNVRIRNGIISGLNVSDGTEQNGGIVVQSNANNITIEDVVVSGCTSAVQEVYGFYLNSCNDVKLINCEASNNTNTLASSSGVDGNVNGFYVDGCNACVLQSCRANRNTSADQNSYGVRLDSANYIKVINCSALNQISNSNDASDLAAGFYSNAGTGNLFEKCVSIGNTGGSNATSLGVGFMLEGGSQYSTIKNCMAQANNASAGYGHGIDIDSSVIDCVVRDNVVFANTGGAAGVGIIDAGSSRVMYTNNFGHSNSIPGGAVDNYSGTIGEISTATHSSFTNLDSTKTGYNNLEIVG